MNDMLASIVCDTPCCQGVSSLATTELKSGITTGACATAAAKAAVLAWQGTMASVVAIDTPTGRTLSVPVVDAEALPDGGRATVIKDAGDDPDITHGVSVTVTVKIWPGEPAIRFAAGEGIGRVTLPGLQIPVGEPAINPTICQATAERQQAALRLARQVDVMVVVGGKNSANTRHLAEVCRKAGTRTYHVETAAELEREWFFGANRAGITAGASTPTAAAAWTSPTRSTSPRRPRCTAGPYGR